VGFQLLLKVNSLSRADDIEMINMGAIGGFGWDLDALRYKFFRIQVGKLTTLRIPTIEML